MKFLARLSEAVLARFVPRTAARACCDCYETCCGLDWCQCCWIQSERRYSCHTIARHVC